MFTLTTHQSSIWGYDAKLYPSGLSSQVTAIEGSFGNTGAFTPFAMAPNGNFYCILTNPAIHLNTIPNQYVIAKISPGTTNTATTNWSEASVEYFTEDHLNGRPKWMGNAGAFTMNTAEDNSKIKFAHRGILAGNGKIYFMPFNFSATSFYDTNNPNIGKWVILDPSTDTWTTEELGPTTTLANNCAVLGSDGYIYVLPYGMYTPFYRIHPAGVTINGVTPSTNVVTNGYWDASTSGRRLFSYLNSLNWYNETGAGFTDSASVGGATPAYSGKNNHPVTFTDAITHPNGNIYLIPAAGRGRIFYIKPSNFGNLNEICSAPGLITSAIPGETTQKAIVAYSCILEKPKSTTTDYTSLKIFIYPRLSYTSPIINDFEKVIVLNPTTNTLTSENLQFVRAGSSTSFAQIGRPIALPNGVNFATDRSSLSTTNCEGFFVTGDSAGSNNYKIKTALTPGFINNEDLFRSPLYPRPAFMEGAAYNGIGSGISPKYPHNGKTLVNSGDAFSEITSVKGYAPGVTNFDFKEADKNMYEVPSNVATIHTTLYNSVFNKPR